MTETVRERETKLAVPADFVLPALEDCAPAVAETGTEELRATYFDAADLRLLRSGVTLRRRLGGADAGWHLKLPTGSDHDRLELRRPITAGEGQEGAEGLAVPDELVELAFARTRGAPLVPVAELVTRRRTVELRDEGGATLARVSDDAVTATLPGGDSAAWREIEVEEDERGGESAGRVACRVTALLTAHGACPDERGPKLAHALGFSVSSPGATVGGGRPGAGASAPSGEASAAAASVSGVGAAADSGAAAGRGRAGPGRGRGRRRRPEGHPAATEAVLARLCGQAEELARRDVDVRRGEDEAVHEMRIACRRLSACLRSFDALFEGTAPGQLGGEARWLAGLLGEVRDGEVLRAAVEDGLAALAPEQLLGPVRATLSGRLAAAEARAGAALAEAMRGDRYAALLGSLASFVTAPPLRPLRRTEARRLVSAAVRRDLRRVRRRMRDATQRTGQGRDESLHAARKAAERARYTLETVVPLYGAKAADLAGRYRSVQQALGEQHDAVVLAALLREEGARAGVRPGENGYTYGLLAGLARGRAEAGQARAGKLFSKADRRRRRRFLS